MPPLASLAVSMAVIGLTEAVEGDAHETHRDFPASALRRRPSLSPPTAAPNPCIKSLSQGDIWFRPGFFAHHLGLVVCGTRPQFPYQLQPSRIDASWHMGRP
jgi:hypothetical protein